MTDENVHQAMRKIPGYLDITAADFREVYRLAYRHARERVGRSATACDIMTSPAVTVTKSSELRDVVLPMAEKGVSGVPVLGDAGPVVGVISKKDLLNRMGTAGRATFMAVIADCLKGSGCADLPMCAGKADDIMSAPAIAVRPGATVLGIAHLFTGKNINRAPVVDETGRLVGIVSWADVVRATRGRP